MIRLARRARRGQVLGLLLATWLTTGCVLNEDQRLDEELAAGHYVIQSEAPSRPLETPATFLYAQGSTVRLADNRFDSFEIEGLLRAALGRRLGAIGLTPALQGAPDYLVGYLITSDERAMVAEAMSTIGMPPPSSGAARELPKGALVLAISRPEASELIWKGSIEGAVDPESGPERRQERADLAVAALLRELTSSTGAPGRR